MYGIWLELLKAHLCAKSTHPLPQYLPYLNFYLLKNNPSKIVFTALVAPWQVMWVQPEARGV